MIPNNYFERAGTVAATGAGTILGTQAANQVYTLFELQIQLEGTGPQSFIIGGGSVNPRVYCANAGDGMVKVWGAIVGDGGLWHTLPGAALTIEPSGSALYNYYVRGYTAAVY